MNARQILGNTHPSDYFAPVKKLAFHNLTEKDELPKDTNQLLGLGLKFIPVPSINITRDAVDRSLSRFERDINLRIFFSGDENDTSYDPKALRGKSSWRAPIPPREIDNRICRFQKGIEEIFTRRKTMSNLSSLQRQLLQDLKKNENIVILSADKGLGPVGVTMKRYVEWGLKHLTDSSTYTMIAEDAANAESENLYHTIFKWTCDNRKALSSDELKYIRENVEKARKDPYGYFYLLAKLHKTPISTRPVCSDCASLPHSVGKWVDRQLQPIVKQQKTYFQNSFELKRLLNNMELLPPNACLFTYDAISMYTNIDTHQCLQRIEHFLNEATTSDKYPHLFPTALTEALHIVMNNNRMRFGDLYVHQHKGIAMGMAPAPSIANLFVSIYEETHINNYPKTILPFLRRFIDDGFGIWLRDPDPITDANQWAAFKNIVNGMGLQWEFSTRSDKVTFMDLNIHLTDGRLQTSLYAKPLALHLYIPPTSCHAPGIATGLIYGHFYRLFMLCSHMRDIEQEIYLFFNRLLDRGYSLANLIPLFIAAEQNALTQKQKSLLQHDPATNPGDHAQQDDGNNTHGVFFHQQFHPSNPSSGIIQKLWRRTVLTPLDSAPLYHLKNREGHVVDITKLTIAYSRAPNLGNLLSCRKLKISVGDYTDILHEHLNNPHPS